MPVISAAPQPPPNDNSVVLALADVLTPLGLHTLTVNAVTDLAGNPIQPPNNMVEFLGPPL